MATYLVERYWPGVTPAHAQAETARLTALLSGGETSIVETFVTAADEVCFWHVEADTAAQIEAAFAAADIPIDRISAAQAFPAVGPASPAASALAAACGRREPARRLPPER